MRNPFNLLFLAILFLLMTTLSIVLIPVYMTDNADQPTVFMYIGSVVFWFGIIAGYISLFLFYRRNRKIGAKGRIGLISFFRNRYAAIVDLVLLLAIIAVVVLAVLNTGTVVIFSLLFGIIFLFFNLHCICNGRVFHTLISKKRSGRNE